MFVIVDIPSGGDIDGCWKLEIIEKLASEYPTNSFIQHKYSEIEKELDEEKCFVGFWQPQPKTKEEFERQAKEWFECREKVIAAYERNLRKRIF